MTLLLDFCCGAGLAADGYHRAGFDTILGIDILPQPRYPYHFQQDDLTDVGTIRYYIKKYRPTHIHASPPCQSHSDLAYRTGLEYPDLIPVIRAAINWSGLPGIIENVEGAPLVRPILLCGTMFPGLRVERHRLFEGIGVNLTAPSVHLPRSEHPLVFTHDKRKNHHGKLDQSTSFVQVTGGGNCTIENAHDAMGMNHRRLLKRDLNEGIPPAYTQHVGAQLLAA